MKQFQVGTILLPLLLTLPVLPAAAQQRVYNYQCDSGRSFQVEYSSDFARLNTGSGRPIPLAQVEAASGTRYSNGEITLYSKGNEAFVEQNNRRIYSNCVAGNVTTNQVTQSSSTVQTVTYQCRGDRAFSARYSNRQAELQLDNRSLLLSQVVSGSGARYSNGETTLYLKGNNASIEENGNVLYEDCVAQTSNTVRQSSTSTTRQSTTTQQAAPAQSAPTEPVPGMW
jgi:membrane-bound inhibitor of C-type lysozyme